MKWSGDSVFAALALFAPLLRFAGSLEFLLDPAATLPLLSLSTPPFVTALFDW